MYLSSKMTIDPSQLTRIVRTGPTKIFGKIASFLTTGSTSKEEEQETFTAVTILQQINRVMRAVGVENIVRIAADDAVFYEDQEHRDHDLREAIEIFAAEANTRQALRFDTLSLVLEHERDGLYLLIDVAIHRTHKVGEHPIVITINGLLSGLQAGESESIEDLQGRVDEVFESQDSYDRVVDDARESFTAFLDALEAAFHETMDVDDVQRTTRVRVVRPSARVRSKEDVPAPYAESVEPVFRGYVGCPEHLLYSWLWSAAIYDSSVLVEDTEIVNSLGDSLELIAEKPGHDIVFDPEAGQDPTAASLGVGGIAEGAQESGASWIGGLFSSGDAGDVGGASCGSSCGSSCGGGCGGGCGGS